MAVGAQRSNRIVPTDCDQRDELGWVGDANLSGESMILFLTCLDFRYLLSNDNRNGQRWKFTRCGSIHDSDTDLATYRGAGPMLTGFICGSTMMILRRPRST